MTLAAFKQWAADVIARHPEEAEVTLTREQIEEWRKALVNAWPQDVRNDLNSIFDLALRALPPPEAAQVEHEGYCHTQLNTPTRVYDCNCKLRALPLPEGEVKELVRELNIAAGFYADEAGTDKVLRKAAAAVERQAASLATVERERDAYKAENVEVRQTWLRERAELAKAADTAEASLASARRALKEWTDASEETCRVDAKRKLERALASPRQEDTQR